MKRLAMCALVISAAFAQQSPPEDAAAAIEGKKISIHYNAPSVRGRKIFNGPGALQPDDSIWRLGANTATKLHTDATLEFPGLTVPPGEYSLYMFLDKGKWQLIVNKKTGQWGINRDGSTTDNPADELGRVAMKMSKPPAPIEQMKISVLSEGGDKGKLVVEWENVVAETPFTVK
jgi:hypothetical protein